MLGFGRFSPRETKLVRRREFISLVGGAAASPVLQAVSLRAQQTAMTRVGIVTIQSPTSAPYVALRQRLRELGYIEGQNLTLDFVNPTRQSEGSAGAIQELIRRKVDIVLAIYPATMAAVVAAAPGTPVVMVAVDYDPLALGYVKSLAQPATEVTGLYLQQIDLAKKRVELLTQALPDVHAATVFWDTVSEDQWKATASAAPEFGLLLADVQLLDQPYDYEKALAKVPPDFRSVVIFPASPVFYRDRERLAEFTVRQKVATIFAFREWVDAGGLFSYGVDFPAMFRRAAEFVDMIAKGSKPGNLPVEQPTKFELVVNLKTAKAIGIAISSWILVRADAVIE
ncbi:putative ABC transport system substrate-binding protein [Bradyrhizobium sp. USDA 4449]